MSAPSSDAPVGSGRERPARLPAIVREIAPLLIMVVVLLVAVALWEPRFTSTGNVGNLLRNALFLATIASGQMLVMISGGFDLSVGATAALSSVVGSIVMVAAGTLDSGLVAGIVGCLAGLGAGALVGIVNGIAVALFHAPALIVTLGTMSAAGGVAFFLTAGTPVYGMPDLFARELSAARWGDVPLLAIIGLVAVAVVWMLQNLVAFGPHLRAIGGRREAARNAGVPTVRTILAAYVTSGTLAALVGLLLTARLGSGQPTIGLDLMLPSIAVCVIAGVALGGGSGRVERVLLAAVFLVVIANALNLLRFDGRYQTIVIGLVVLGASMLERVWKRGEHA